MVEYEDNTEEIINAQLGVWENMETGHTYLVWSPNVTGIIDGKIVPMVLYYTSIKKKAECYAMPCTEFFSKFKRVKGSYRNE
jgi:hypothetical protein